MRFFCYIVRSIVSEREKTELRRDGAMIAANLLVRFRKSQLDDSQKGELLSILVSSGSEEEQRKYFDLGVDRCLYALDRQDMEKYMNGVSEEDLEEIFERFEKLSREVHQGLNPPS